MTQRNKHYDYFKKALLEVKTKTSGWGGFSFIDPDKPVDLWNSMSNTGKGKLVSDSRWNHYPMQSWTKGSTKKYGLILNTIVSKAISNLDENCLRILTNKSEGVFALFMLDGSPSSIRKKMAKRLYNSPDVRIRTRCARILPIKYMHLLFEDKSYSVRNVAITRVGIDNCYKSFVPESIADFGENSRRNGYWHKSWLERQAIRLSDKEELIPLVKEAIMVTSDDLSGSVLELTLVALIQRMSTEECLYLMQLTEHSPYISRAIKEKLGS